MVIHNTFLKAFIVCLIFYGNDLHENRVLFLTSAPAASPRGTTWADVQLLWIHQDTRVEATYLLGFDVLNLGRRIMLLSHEKWVENFVVPEIWANYSYPVKAWKIKTDQGQASQNQSSVCGSFRLYPEPTESEFLASIFFNTLLPLTGYSKGTLKLENHWVRV